LAELLRRAGVTDVGYEINGRFQSALPQDERECKDDPCPTPNPPPPPPEVIWSEEVPMGYTLEMIWFGGNDYGMRDLGGIIHSFSRAAGKDICEAVKGKAIAPFAALASWLVANGTIPSVITYARVFLAGGATIAEFWAACLALLTPEVIAAALLAIGFSFAILAVESRCSNSLTA
jgi:hypothetical protein